MPLLLLLLACKPRCMFYVEWRKYNCFITAALPLELDRNAQRSGYFAGHPQNNQIVHVSLLHFVGLPLQLWRSDDP